MALAKLLLVPSLCHVTAEQLNAEPAWANMPASLATAYDRLHEFARQELLREVLVDPGRSYFDTNTGDDHHFYFEGSGELREVDNAKVEFARLPEVPGGSR